MIIAPGSRDGAHLAGEPTNSLRMSPEKAKKIALDWLDNHRHELPPRPMLFPREYDWKLEGRAVEVMWDRSTRCTGTLELLVLDDQTVSIGSKTTSEFHDLRTNEPKRHSLP